MSDEKIKNVQGFSLIELLVVLSIMAILGAISVFYLTAYQKLYKADEQAMAIVDILQEARQRSLTQREIIRVEIDMNDNIVRLIDENLPLDETDDQELRRISLRPIGEVKIDSRPLNVTTDPPEPIPAPQAVFIPSVYASSIARRVCTIRFASNGSVLDAGDDGDGANAIPSGVTLNVWMPKVGNDQETDIARAITIIGTTGAVRLWEYDFDSADSNKWKDSRRSSGFGGSTN